MIRSVKQISNKFASNKRLYSTESKPTVAVFGADVYNPLSVYVLKQLIPKANVRIQTQNIEQVKNHLKSRDIDASKVEFFEGNSVNEYSVESTIYGSDAVVNVEQLLIEAERSYLDVYVQGPSNIGTFADKHNVKTFVQTSVMGADLNHESRFLDVNYRGEDMAYGAFPNVTIVRPNFVTFGDKQAIFELFQTRLPLKLSPIIPYPRQARLVRVQPVHINDVATAITKVTLEQDMSGKIIELGGETTLTVKNLLGKMLSPKLFVPVPKGIIHGIYGVTQFLPGAVISRDHVPMVCSSMMDDSGSLLTDMCAGANLPRDPAQQKRYATFKDLNIQPIGI